MVYSFYHHGATQSRKHLNNRIPWPNTASSRAGNRERDGVYATASHLNLAAFAAHLAISLPHPCHILPFLATFAAQNAQCQVADPPHRA
jgi:hypothetical protein